MRREPKFAIGYVMPRDLCESRHPETGTRCWFTAGHTFKKHGGQTAPDANPYFGRWVEWREESPATDEG